MADGYYLKGGVKVPTRSSTPVTITTKSKTPELIAKEKAQAERSKIISTLAGGGSVGGAKLVGQTVVSAEGKPIGVSTLQYQQNTLQYQQNVAKAIGGAGTPVYGSNGQLVGIESNITGQAKTYSIDEYNKLVGNLPKQVPINIITNQPSIIKNLATGQISATPFTPNSLYKTGYITPQGKVLQNQAEVDAYLQSKKILLTGQAPTKLEQLKEYVAPESYYTYKQLQAQPIGEVGFIQRNVSPEIRLNVESIYKDTERFLQKGLSWIPAQEIGQAFSQASAVPIFLLSGQKEALKPNPVSQFVGGVVGGALQDVKDKPIQNIGLLALGYGLGFGTGAVSKAVTLVPKVGGALSTGVKASMLGAGIYFTGLSAIELNKQIAMEQNDYNKGAIFGTAIKDLGLTAVGFGAGQKGYNKFEGKLSTLGREYLPTEQGVYPQAPTNKQVEMFQKNVIKELGKEAGAFHTTADKFWKNTLEPKSGTSELAGVYGSTKVSTSFARIQGSEVTPVKETGFIKSLVQAVKDYLKPSASPAVGYLKPLKFRGVEVAFSRTPLFEGQKAINGLYAYITTPAKLGVADVPLIKTEIEAVFRPGAGAYIFESGNYYTKIAGVNVPIDVFKSENAIAKTIALMNKNLGKVANIGGVKAYGGSSSYNLPVSDYLKIPFGLTSSSKAVSSKPTPLPSYKIPSSSIISSTSLPPYPYSGGSSSGSSKSSLSSISLPPSSISPPSSVARPPSNISPPSSGVSFGQFNMLYQDFKKISRKEDRRIEKKKEKNLGEGYFAYGKMINTNVFKKLNEVPVTRSRALDIGAFYVDQTLARTFKVKSAGKKAQEGNTFAYIPVNYYQSVAKKLREFKIRKRQLVDIGMQFIEKNIGIADTRQEKSQLAYFRNLQKQLDKQFK